MKQKNILKALCTLCATLVLFAVGAVPIFAANDVPQAVLDARQGVVRIMVETSEGVGIGTGFAVGEGDDVHVVTNHHVIADATKIQIYYDTDRFVEGEVVADSPSKDLAVLEPARRIPDVATLPLRTDDFDSGTAVYALGFPFAADLLTMDLTVENVEDIHFDSTKQAITITDGIISAIRESTIFGDQTKTVKAIQTNTSISQGNSGGPLVDKAGSVLGINTLGITMGQNINASVHVSELVSLLKSNRIPFEEPAGEDGAAPPTPGDGVDPVIVVGLGVAGVALVGAVVAIAIQKAKKKKNRDAGVSLDDYLRGGRP